LPLPSSAEVVDGHVLSVGGVPVQDLAERFGTPLYVLDHAELVGRMRTYVSSFGPAVAVTYAAKALCVTAVLQLAAREGLHLDVASAGELHTAVRAGFPMDRVIMHGNNKSVEELTLAVDLGVRRIVADSLVELDRLETIASARGGRVPVLLRITPGVGAGGHEFIRTGQDDSKFGFTLSSGLADTAIDRVVDSPHLELGGLHCHVGSQVTAGEAFSAATEVMVGPRRAGAAAARRGHRRAEPRRRTRHRLPAGRRRSVDRAVRGGAADRGPDGERAHGIDIPRIAVEPGRSVVGPAGLTLYTVGTVKEIPGIRSYAAVDGGMSDNLRPALYGARYSFLPGGAPHPDSQTEPHTYTVVGKHCETGDVLGQSVSLPGQLVPGDLLVAAATGAYGYSMASNYNRLPRPRWCSFGTGMPRHRSARELDDVLSHDVPLAD
jgi:diaminopimelate decarboxylase